jgi:hypothetical protein
MSATKDQSSEITPLRVRSPREASTDTDSLFGASQPLFAPTAEREGMLPPANGSPSAARAADLMTESETMPDVAARARMSIALQRNIGNARMGEMLRSIPKPQPPPPLAPSVALSAPEPAQPTPPPAAAQPAKPATPVKPTPSDTAPAAPEKTNVPVATAPPLAAEKMPPAKAATTGGAAQQAAPSAPESAHAASGQLPEMAAEAPAAKKAAKSEAGKAPAAAKEAAEGGEGEKKGAGAGASAVKLKIPEPPADIPPATRGRIRKVQAAAGHTAASQAHLPTAKEHVDDAHAAVTEPTEETHAHAEEGLVVALGKRPAPSPKIEALCLRIYQVIRAKRPPDEDSLVDADPEAMGKAAGGLMKGDVQTDVQSVDQSYAPLDKPPAGTRQQEGKPLEPAPAAAASPAISATSATPDKVPAKNVSLDADVDDTKARMADAGMEKETAKLAQTGPVAEARQAQGELEQVAQEDPAKVLAAQQSSLAKANADMAALQQQALNALTSSRRKTVTSTGGKQQKMVGSEADMRTAASKEARGYFTTAQKQVDDLLRPLPKNAMDKWDKGVAVASQQFKQHLAQVAKWIKERHSGVGGTLLSIGDYFTGLPDWVTDHYDQAEQKFGDDVCTLAREISTEVNGIIMTCEAIIADARTQIAGVFSRLPDSLKAWADGEQAQLGKELDGLQNHAHQVRDNFDRELVTRASQSVQEVREQIQELRQKAKGLIGRVIDAVGRFLDDPIKFIIEALLDLLSIPKAAFWAVVAKIQKVIGDIADDPMKFANNLMDAVGKGFSQFFDNILDHLLHGFVEWLTGGLASAGVALPRDFSVKSVITFFLELMGITWPRIRKLLAKHIGEENVALLEKAYSIVANLVAMGPEGVFEMIREKLNPAEILDQIIKAAVDYMMKAIVKAVAARIVLLFNPVGAILQALEAIYRVLKWIFTNAARIFRLIETIVNGIADILAGNIGAMANAVEKALAGLIPPVIDFLADYLGFGDLPDKVRDTILGFQAWIEGILDQVIGWLVEKGKALLAAVGLGGKEEAQDKEKKASGDQEVGMTVTFYAGSHKHKLWIEVGGAGAEARVASDEPKSVKDRLADWETRLTGEGNENPRKEEALKAIAGAKATLGITEEKAQEAIPLQQEVKNNAENAEAGKQFQKADDATEEAEKALGDYLAILFEIFGEKKDILVLLGKQLVTRGEGKGAARTRDRMTEEGKQVATYNYELRYIEATKRYHIQRTDTAKQLAVHIDEEGKLQEGPGRAAVATDEEKIEVYDRLMQHASEDLKPFSDIDDADTYREKARTAITKEIGGNSRKLLRFMKRSKEDPAIPSQYNRLRGDIYDICVSGNSATRYTRPGPVFLKVDYPSLEAAVRRQPDGLNGDELYESKGHQGLGPQEDEKSQYRDNVKIVTRNYKSSDDQGPFVRINYIIKDFDARDAWKDLLKSTRVSIIPED